MKVLNDLFSLWQSERTPDERTELARLLPDETTLKEVYELLESSEKQAFFIGFRITLELAKELETVK